MLLRDAGGQDLIPTLEFLHGRLTYLIGRGRLTQSSTRHVHEDAMAFLQTCSDANFLDAIEYIILSDAGPILGGQQKEVVARLNEFLSIDDLLISSPNSVGALGFRRWGSFFVAKHPAS